MFVGAFTDLLLVIGQFYYCVAYWILSYFTCPAK